MTSTTSTPTASNVDYSLPLASLLRESTHEAHETVAKSQGATALLSGKLPRDEYVRYLMMLWYIYDTFERALDRHATHPTLEPTYNPALLARAVTLAADISYLLQVPESSWKQHPIHQELMTAPPASLTAYVGRLNEIAGAQDPSPLLAHAYVRYLGDLSGGQTIRHTLAKAYDLDEATATGLSFYAFKELRSAKMANQGEIKRIKDWFREGMNAAGNDNLRVKAAVLGEASRAFDLNTDLFASIRVPDNNEAPVRQKGSKDSPVIIEYDPPETAFRLSSVVAVLAAVCLAHFLLVVTGFTGNNGYQKFIAFEDWFDAIWQSRPE